MGNSAVTMKGMKYVKYVSSLLSCRVGCSCDAGVRVVSMCRVNISEGHPVHPKRAQSIILELYIRSSVIFWKNVEFLG